MPGPAPQLDVAVRRRCAVWVAVTAGLTCAGACSPRDFSLGRLVDAAADGSPALGAWVQSFPGAGDQRVRALAVDEQGVVFAAGQTPGEAADELRANVFVASVTGGDVRWNVPLARDRGYDDDAVAVHLSDAEVTVLGSFGVTSDEFVMFADRFARVGGAAGPQGRPFGETGHQRLEAVAEEGTRRLLGGVLQDAAPVAPGWLQGAATDGDVATGVVAAFVGETPAWGRAFSATSVVTGVALRAGAAYVAALAHAAPAPADELGRLVLLKLDGDGAQLARREFDSTDNVAGVRLAVAGDGTLIALGTFSGQLVLGGATLASGDREDTFIAGFDDALSPKWAFALVGGSTTTGDAGRAMAAVSGGALIACGRCAPPGAADPDDAVAAVAFVSSADGLVARWTPLDAVGEVEVDALATRDGVTAYVGGGFRGSLTSGGTRVTSSAGRDGFVLATPVR